MTGRAFAWPDGKRIAVTVNAMLETWSEGKAPPYGVQASQHKPGVDHSGIAWGSYGGKVGVWRLMALLNRHGIRGTFCVNARCAEIYPEAVAAIVQQGHDVAGHGYLQDQLLTALAPDEEQAAIRRSLEILERATGQRPMGWISPVTAFTEHTRKFLAAEKLLWHGDARDTDLPSVVETAGGPIVQIPGSDFTDNRTLRSSPQDIWDVYKETFDYLRECEPPGFLAHVAAQPFRRAADDHRGIREGSRLHAPARRRLVLLVRRDRALGDGHPARRRHPRAPFAQD